MYKLLPCFLALLLVDRVDQVSGESLGYGFIKTTPSDTSLRRAPR
jgi:hypothetical protein